MHAQLCFLSFSFRFLIQGIVLESFIVWQYFKVTDLPCIKSSIHAVRVHKGAITMQLSCIRSPPPP